MVSTVHIVSIINSHYGIKNKVFTDLRAAESYFEEKVHRLSMEDGYEVYLEENVKIS